MIKFQQLRDLAVFARPLLISAISLNLAVASSFSYAESQPTLDDSPVTRTRSSIFKIKSTELNRKVGNEEAITKALSRFGLRRDSHKIVSISRDKTGLLVLSTDKPSEFKGFSNGNYGSYNRSFFGRRFNRYTHKFNMMQLATVQGVITSSLHEAGKTAGMSEELIDQLTRVFGWDIDFANNLHEGDRFTVVYERGSNNGQDDIVAAEFINRGKSHRAVRYIDKEGYANYYSPEGHILQKSFLSTPVDFVRISSGFNMHRHHPVLNRIRAHKGVDYAARTGTPVKATGNGMVTFVGRKGGYGQVVIIQHGERYETLYAHLSKFKPGLYEGSPVRQGEVIGFVGQTGLATGPHLHYEFRIDGIHQNPLTAQLSNSVPIKSTELAEFKSQIQDPLAKLNMVKANTLFAKRSIGYN